MKKSIALFLLGFFCASLSIAQKTDSQIQKDRAPETKKKQVEKPARDFLVLALTYDNWAQAPVGTRITGFGRGFSGHILYDFPINQSHFSFAGGLGISSNNVYFDKQIPVLNSASSEFTLQDLDTSIASRYKMAKLNTTYLELPLELRYFANKENRNSGFKAAVGMHVGMLVGAHSKVRHSAPDLPELINEKVNSKRYFQKWRFAPIVRLGWGNFQVYGSYSLSSLFNEGAGPQVYPYSIGISISGL